MAKRTRIPPMIDNPQRLVPSQTNVESPGFAKKSPTLDAVYVPFKNRFQNVKGLLRELQHYKGPIYLLPTLDRSVNTFGDSLGKNVKVLHAENRALQRLYAGLCTSSHRHMKKYRERWDLPIKRNFAIQHALTMEYERIMLVDDDIRSISKECLATGTQCLDNYTLAGCFVDDFIDTSVMGHLEHAAGDPVYPFLSGSFLLLRPHDVEGFFPCIYNEDWLFMILHIVDRTICSFGTVGQLKFDPFGVSGRSVFQEFGDLLVDGLYALLADDQYRRRHDKDVWAGLIAQRREFILSLSDRLPKKKHQRIIEKMLDVSNDITPTDCQLFIHGWEKDLIAWKQYIGRFQ